MALSYSTGAKKARAGKQALPHALLRGTTIAFVDGGSGEDTITDSGNGFVTAGFRVGDKIRILTASGTNDKAAGVVCTAVAAGVLNFATATFTAEGAGQQVVLAAAKGGSIKDLFDFGVIRLYSGPRPSSADAAETGTLLAVITSDGGAFTGGALANGLRFSADAVDDYIEKLAAQTWKTLSCDASGTVLWGRIYDNAYTLGASTSAVRADFGVGVSGTEMTGSPTTLTAGKPTSVDTFKVTVR